MSTGVSQRAGAAMRWRAAQLSGVQAIYFLRLLILAKLLAPEAFGLLAIASIAVSVLMVLSDLGMIPALVQRREATAEEANAAWTVGLARAVAVAVLLAATAPLVAIAFSEPRAAPIIQVLALRPVIEAAASIGIARVTRELRFRELALIYLPAALVDLITAVALAPTLGVWALVIGALAGSLTTLVMSYAYAPHRPRLCFRWAAIAPLVEYGRWVLAKGVILMLGTLATQLAISRMLGTIALGLFFLAVKVAYLPLEASSKVIGAVAFPLFSSLRDDAAGTRRAFSTLLAAAGVLLMPAYAMLFALAPLLEQALGDRWLGTAPIVQILSVAAVTAILADLLAPLLMGRGRADKAFRLEFLTRIVLAGVLLPGIWWLGLNGAATAWLIGGVATLVLSVLWVREDVPGALGAAGGRLAAAALAALVAGGAAALTAASLHGVAGLIAGSLAGLATAAIVLWRLNRRLGLRLDELRAMFLSRARAEGGT